MTTDTEPVSLEELLELRQEAVNGIAAVDDLIVRSGPVSLKFQLESIRQDAAALVARLESLERGRRSSWRDVADMDLPELRDEMDELLAEVTGLVTTPRTPADQSEGFDL